MGNRLNYVLHALRDIRTSIMHETNKVSIQELRLRSSCENILPKRRRILSDRKLITNKK
jgi:hypothetical protein